MKNQKKKARVLPLSMRGKKRYISFHLDSDAALNEREVFESLMKTFFELFGTLGVAKQRLHFISFSGSKGIIRCAHKKVKECKAGILFLKKVNGKEVSPQILSVSGSLKKLKRR